MAQSRRVLFRGVALLVLSGCAGTIGEGDAEGGIAGKGTCASDSVPKVRPALRRLTRFEYNNTVRDLLG
ncbi:MAG TPA: DUF1587 domain-containing protein, partial [Myxococcaceae bacterium]|nr:DUF1587 domain-containing protein [Myxococcaceae bacterium]